MMKNSRESLLNFGTGQFLKQIHFFIWACFLLTGGCASSSSGINAEKPDHLISFTNIDSSGNRESKQIVKLPDYVDKGPVFYAKPPEFDLKAMSTPPWIDDANPATVNVSRRSSEGYRIQIYSGRDKALAKRIESDALNRSGLEVYLNYEAPQYKIRAGNFTDRSQAVIECDRLKQMGFTEAWVVRTTISVQ